MNHPPLQWTPISYALSGIVILLLVTLVVYVGWAFFKSRNRPYTCWIDDDSK